MLPTWHQSMELRSESYVLLGGRYDLGTDKKVRMKQELEVPATSWIRAELLGKGYLTYGIHIAHISSIYKSSGLEEGDLVTVTGGIFTQAAQDVRKRLGFVHH